MSPVAVVVSLVSYLPVEFDRRATNHIARMTAAALPARS
jgi:hypothetical protein